MLVLGLDMSTQKTGYAVFEIDNTIKTLIDYGCIEKLSTDESDWRKRITYMANKMGEIMSKHDIDRVYIEDVPPIINNSQTVKTLGALQGIVLGVMGVFDVEVEFIPVATWKTKLGINLTHSKQFNSVKKELKDNKKELERFKGQVKAYEKKMSIDLVNEMFGIDLVWKSFSSKKNQDDIADAINIVSSAIFDDTYHYNLKNFSEIIDELR